MERLFQSVLLLSELYTNLYIHTPKVTRFIDIFSCVSDCVYVCVCVSKLRCVLTLSPIQTSFDTFANRADPDQSCLTKVYSVADGIIHY